ncbi:MAG: PAS domain-containing protein, partial [Clostridia bacterium]|nr:PAS domain-containing protein [Clostridia bacterium]
MSMRVKAALVIMAIVFVFTVASFFLSLSFTQRHMTETIEHELTLALDIADTVVATKIKLLKSNAETMAARINAVSEAEMAETMAALRLEFGEFISLTVYDRTGSIANDGAPIEHDVFHLESQYIDSALHGDTFLTSAHYNNTNTGGDLVIHVFVPMGSDRVLSATIPGMLFSGILSEYRLWQTGSIFMVDAQGAFVASLRSDLVLEQRNLINDAINDPELASAGEFYKAMITSDQGHNSGRYTFEGTERLCVYKHVSGSKVGWYIGVTAPLSESPLQNIQDGLLLSALFFLAAGAIVSIFVSGIVAKPFITIQTQAAAIHEAHEQTTLLLDAMPFACNWWDRSLRLSGCNEGTIRLFQLSGRQEFIDHFYDFSPEYQPDGKLSAEEAVIKLKKAFEEGRCVFEWAHQKRDGTPIPTEVTLIRIAHNNGYVVAGYVRDLREYKQMMNEIDRNTQLLSTMNQVANILLQPESDKFEEKL